MKARIYFNLMLPKPCVNWGLVQSVLPLDKEHTMFTRNTVLARPGQRVFQLAVCVFVLSALLNLQPGPVSAGNVGGIIDTDTTWSLGGSPYIVTSPIWVLEGVTLTIEPGVTVRFDSHRAMQIDGELLALGTSGSPVTFTSNAAVPAPGDWDFITFTNTSQDALYDVSGNYVSGSTLQYVILEYGGGASVDNNGTLRLDAAAPYLLSSTLRHSASGGVNGFNFTSDMTFKAAHNTIRDNAGTGIRVTGGGYVEITDNVMINNVYSATSLGGGIRLDTTSNLIRGNLIRGNNSDWSGSGIQVLGGSSTIRDNEITDNSIWNCSNCWDNAAFTVSGGPVEISNNLVAHNVSGAIRVFDANNVTILENMLIHNQGKALSLGCYTFWECGNGTVARNILSDNTTGIDQGAFTAYRYKNLAVNHNAILRNTALDRVALRNQFIGNNVDGSVYSANTITGNIALGAPGSQCIVSIEGLPLFIDNNIFNNSSYALSNINTQGSANLNAENNWWGTAVSADIQSLIHDYFDDPAQGIVDFLPYRGSFNLEAPVSPPGGVTVTSGLTSLGVSWAANPESDVTGYNVYYDLDGRYPYSGTGADQGNSPIDVGSAQSLTLTGLPDGRYHVLVTAYDNAADGVKDQTDGNESWFSLDTTGILGVPPHADFSADPQAGNLPLAVAFTNLSSGNYSTCAWDFGDGGSSTDCNNPAHTYTASGLYTVRLTIDGVSGTSLAEKTGYISVNTPPVAVDQSPVLDEDTYYSGNLGATDADSDPLTFALGTAPAHGSAVVNADGSFTYTPAPNYNGSDSFTFIVSDGRGGSDEGTVSITISPVNDAPVAASDAYTGVAGSPLTVAAPGVLANDSDVDGDPLTAIQLSWPANGTLAFNADGSFTYTPLAGWSGPDSFTYHASDGLSASEITTVTLTINPPPEVKVFLPLIVR